MILPTATKTRACAQVVNSFHASERTRADLLRFAIAFALRGARKLVRGLPQELTEEERYRVADDVVDRLQQHGVAITMNTAYQNGQGTTEYSRYCPN